MPDIELIRLVQKPLEIAPLAGDLIFLDGTRGVRGLTWLQFLDLLVQTLTTVTGADVATLTAIKDAQLMAEFSAGVKKKVATMDSDGIISSATVKWGDGATGVYSGANKNATFLEYDSWSVTYVGSVSRTYTQPLVTRDVNGRITNYPDVIVT